MATVEELQLQVILENETLSWLSPESLLQFKSVCKSWYALINDPKFITKHFSNSLQHKHVLLQRLVTNNSGKKEIILSILKFPLDLDGSVSALDVHLPFDEKYHCLGIHGHSHGLICLNDLYEEVFICNPTTREYRELPPSILLLTEPPSEPDGFDSLTNAVGFGYDAKSRDFKVVRVVDFYEGGLCCYQRVEIYDLSKDRWREIEAPTFGNGIGNPLFEIYQEKTYYWLANNGVYNEFIQSFNMSEEVFGKISIPESCFGEQPGKNRSIGILNGSIIFFLYPWKGNADTFDVWEMDKHESGGASWSKLFTVGPVSGIEKPFWFLSSDELLMESEEGQLILYYTKTQHFKALPIKGHPESFQAIFFFKSLLSAKGGNNIPYEF